MNYNDLTDIELRNKLDKAVTADKFLQSEEYKLLKEAADRIVGRTIDKFIFKTNSSDIVAIEEIKAIIRKWKYGLFGEINSVLQEGSVAFEEAKESGALDYQIRFASEQGNTTKSR